ncbi:MAG: NAD(P)-binding domain-containing protein [Polyangiaceae bacterium]|nr:NAD(P)-binding domain-containing protein [Polyangiaceae bacterium]
MHVYPSDPGKVCVIGAGPSGLAAVKALTDAGVALECFEKGDRVGGNWVFRNTNGLSSAYRSLHINTSKKRSQFSDFPMPEDYPDYPRHDLMAKYFESFALAFGLMRVIQFNTSVKRVDRIPGGSWRVTLSNGEVREYRAVVVANGHHWDPRYPDPPPEGTFNGVTFHSHHYVDPLEPHDLRDKNVVVVGIGNSAVDIACELSHAGNAHRVFLSTRRGAYVLPKYLLGKPIDAGLSLPDWLPQKRLIATRLFEALVGKMEDFGLPRPDHRLLEAHPTVSSELLTRLGSGDVTPKPAIRRYLGHQVEFLDGTQEPIDAVIYCTGYRVSFPFFDPDLVSAPNNELSLFHRVFHPEHPGLFFVGLCQPLGAIFPLAEVQSRWIAEYLNADYALPSKESMLAQLERDRIALKKRYVRSARHTLQVDVERYLRAVEKERKSGRKRAKQ